MGKRFILIMLLICILVPAVSVPVYGTDALFTDVGSSDWFFDEVNYAYDKGLMNGVGGGRFDPAGITTRGMLVTVLHRLSGDQGSYSFTFQDVEPGSYCEKAIAWASSKGVVYGYSKVQFGPNDLLTREQIATILYRYAKLNGKDVSGKTDISDYADCGEIGDFALEAMQWANHAGLITGRTEVTLAPKAAASRAEMATILYRFCEKMDAEEPPSPDDGGEEPNPDDGKEDSKTDDGEETPKPDEGQEDPKPDDGAEPATIYKVSFDLNNSTYAVVQVNGGEEISPPEPPERFGYRFLGWYTQPQGGEPVSFPLTVEKDITLYAQWEENNQAESPNVFVLTGTYQPDQETVVVELQLQGDVELCGFDMRLKYDTGLVELQNLDTDCGFDLMASSNSEKGEIAFNFAAAKNTTKGKQILVATFHVTGEAGEMMKFALKPIEVIRTDADFEIHPAEHTCVNWKTSIW